MPKLSVATGVARPSPTLALTARANALKAEGKDIIAFGAGEPDFNTPEPICAAAKRAIDEGFTKYTPSAGIPALKQAIVEKVARENGFTVGTDQVTVTCGAKHAVFNALWATVSPGDEVILVAPYWATYRDQIRLMGGVPVVVTAPAETGFVPDVETVRAHITPRTRVLLLNSPTNPTGAVYPEATLRQLAALAEEFDLWILSDEIYERLVYEGTHYSVASFAPEVAARTLTVSGCSKTYSMTGWRIGYLIAPREVTREISAFQDQVTSNPTSFAQRGAVVALNLESEAVESMRREFDIRRQRMMASLREIPGVGCTMPKGAFYFFADFRTFLGDRFANDMALAEFLLVEAGVAVVPGSFFEGPGFLRLSYTASQHDIQRGIERIGTALASLQM